MKANADKCNLLLSTKEKLTANVSNFEIINSNKEKLLAITIDNHLKFASYVESLFRKSQPKIICALKNVLLYEP